MNNNNQGTDGSAKDKAVDLKEKAADFASNAAGTIKDKAVDATDAINDKPKEASNSAHF